MQETYHFFGNISSLSTSLVSSIQNSVCLSKKLKVDVSAQIGFREANFVGSEFPECFS